MSQHKNNSVFPSPFFSFLGFFSMTPVTPIPASFPFCPFSVSLPCISPFRTIRWSPTGASNGPIQSILIILPRGRQKAKGVSRVRKGKQCTEKGRDEGQKEHCTRIRLSYFEYQQQPTRELTKEKEKEEKGNAKRAALVPLHFPQEE